jgi:hypothetical protein
MFGNIPFMSICNEKFAKNSAPKKQYEVGAFYADSELARWYVLKNWFRKKGIGRKLWKVQNLKNLKFA